MARAKHLCETDYLYTVHAFSKFDKYHCYSQVETNVLGQEQRIVIEQLVLLFFCQYIFVKFTQCLALKMSNNLDFRIIHTN